jgi:hypothetical protein
MAAVFDIARAPASFSCKVRQLLDERNRKTATNGAV